MKSSGEQDEEKKKIGDGIDNNVLVIIGNSTYNVQNNT